MPGDLRWPRRNSLEIIGTDACKLSPRHFDPPSKSSSVRWGRERRGNWSLKSSAFRERGDGWRDVVPVRGTSVTSVLLWGSLAM